MSASFIGGCISDNRSYVEKANDLLKQRNLCSVEKLDSVFEYKDVHSCMCAAHNLQWVADSMLLSHQRNGTQWSAKEKKDAIDYAYSVYNLKKESAKLTLKHDIAQDKKEFVGYSVLITDSLTGAIIKVYFDRDVTKISAIDRKISYE